MTVLRTLLALFPLCLVPVPIWADEEAESPKDTGLPFTRATVTKVVNDVKIVDAKSLEQSPAQVDLTFEAPDLMATARRSRAELLAPDGTITRVGSNTIFAFDPEQRIIDLKTGSLLFHSPEGKGGGTIRTSEASASVLGTTIMASATSNGGFKLIVLEGVAEIVYPDGTVDVLEAGQVTFITPGDGQRAPILNLNLEELVATSQLVNGFEEPLASYAQIDVEARRQARRITGPSNLLLGDATAAGEFQIIEVPEDFVVVIDEEAREQQPGFGSIVGNLPGEDPGFGATLDPVAAQAQLLALGLTLNESSTVLSWNPTVAEFEVALTYGEENLRYLTMVADEPIFETLVEAGLDAEDISLLASFNEGEGLTNQDLVNITNLSSEVITELFARDNVEVILLLAGSRLDETILLEALQNYSEETFNQLLALDSESLELLLLEAQLEESELVALLNADSELFTLLTSEALDESTVLNAVQEYSVETFDQLLALGVEELQILLLRAELSEDDFVTLLSGEPGLIVAAGNLQSAMQADSRSQNETVILNALFDIGDGIINEQLIAAGLLGNVLLTNSFVNDGVPDDNQVFSRQELVANGYNEFVISLLGEVSGRQDITDSILEFLNETDPSGFGATLDSFAGANGSLLGTRDFDDTGDFFGVTPDDIVAFIGNDISLNASNLDVSTYVNQASGLPSGTVQGKVFVFAALDDLVFDIPVSDRGPGDEVSDLIRELVIDSGDPAADTAVAIGANDEVRFRRFEDDRDVPVSIVHQGSHLAIGSGADLNVLNVRLTSTDGSVSLATLENLLVAEGSEITPGDQENVYLYADKTLTADRLVFNGNPRDIVMNATTINLSNLDFPLAANVDLRSMNGPINGKYPNFGSSAPGRVNFIQNVSRGGNVIFNETTFDQFSGGKINIGTAQGF